MCFKKLISWRYTKEIPVSQLLKNPQKILVLLPLHTYQLSSFIPALQFLRNKFKTAEIIGVLKQGDALFFERSGAFNKIIKYESKPRFMSRQYFRLRSKLRNIKASLSFDFNLHTDLLSWLGGATLRVGLQDSPFINCRVKLSKVLNEEEQALGLVKTVCIGHYV